MKRQFRIAVQIGVKLFDIGVDRIDLRCADALQTNNSVAIKWLTAMRFIILSGLVQMLSRLPLERRGHVRAVEGRRLVSGVIR